MDQRDVLTLLHGKGVLFVPWGNLGIFLGILTWILMVGSVISVSILLERAVSHYGQYRHRGNAVPSPVTIILLLAGVLLRALCSVVFEGLDRWEIFLFFATLALLGHAVFRRMQIAEMDEEMRDRARVFQSRITEFVQDLRQRNRR